MTALLFAGDYPAGGWDDLVGEFDSIDAAKATIDGTRRETHYPSRQYTFDGTMVSSTGTLMADMHPTFTVGQRINGNSTVIAVEGDDITVQTDASDCVSFDYGWAQIVVDGRVVARFDGGAWLAEQ